MLSSQGPSLSEEGQRKSQRHQDLLSLTHPSCSRTASVDLLDTGWRRNDWQTDGHTRGHRNPGTRWAGKEGIAVVRVPGRIQTLRGWQESQVAEGVGGEGSRPAAHAASRLSEPPALTWEGRSVCSLMRTLGILRLDLDFGIAALNSSLPLQGSFLPSVNGEVRLCLFRV